jgi:hypothetical protein
MLLQHAIVLSSGIESAVGNKFTWSYCRFKDDETAILMMNKVRKYNNTALDLKEEVKICIKV